MQEKRIDDYWNVDSKKQFLRSVERIHEFYLVEAEVTKRIHVVCEETDKHGLPDQIMYGQKYGRK